MSIKRRLQRLEERTPINPLTWDGDPETAEAFVKAMAKKEKAGRNPGPFEGEDPEAYVNQKMQ